MKRFFTDILCVAWPPYRRRKEERRAWSIVLGAALYLLGRPDWNRGDYEAGKLLGRKMRELNRQRGA